MGAAGSSSSIKGTQNIALPVKILLCGETGVGKTEIDGGIWLLDGASVPLVVIDGAAPQDEEEMIQVRDTFRPDGILLLFSLVDHASFECLPQIYAPFTEKDPSAVDSRFPTVIAGTKLDLLEGVSEAAVVAEEVFNVAAGILRVKPVRYFETSSLAGADVQSAVRECIRLVLQRRGVRPANGAGKKQKKSKAEEKVKDICIDV